MAGRITSEAEKLWPKVIKTDGCWLFTGHKNSYGYGLIVTVRRPVVISKLAHRLAWELVNGPIPPRMKVLHRCDVRACVRPDHLFLGTDGDNVRDMVAKGRHFCQKQTSCKRGHKYTPENTYLTKGGTRSCRACANLSSAKYYERRVASGARKRFGGAWESPL